MNRVLGAILASTWLIAMSALINRDILPLWTAQEPPREVIPSGDSQISIQNEDGVRVGTTWITTTATAGGTMVRSATVLDAGRVTRLLKSAGRWLIQSDLSYEPDGALSEFRFSLAAPGFKALVEAERLERDFSCVARIGEIKRTLLLDGQLSQYLSETLRPFTHLENLRVGQSWRIRLLDPLSMMRSGGIEFQTQLAKVTRRETIRHENGDVECFRIETPGAIAWADKDGTILRQEVQLPIGGRWTMLDEPVDVEARKAALRAAADRTRGSVPVYIADDETLVTGNP